MASEVLLIKALNRLAAYDPISEETIAGIKQGEVVKATITRPRNNGHMRKFFVLIDLVFTNQSRYATKGLVLAWFKRAVGLGEWLEDRNGKVFIPGSISFSKMDQASFDQFYQRAVDMLVTELLPKTSNAELCNRVEEIIAGRAL